MHKYSSNVVERCLEKGGDIMVSLFIDEITYLNRVYDLIKNNYGNYVVQKALTVSLPDARMKLINNICQNISRITDKKLMMKWQLIIKNNLDYLSKINMINNYGNTMCNTKINPIFYQNPYITQMSCINFQGKLEFDNNNIFYSQNINNNVNNFNFGGCLRGNYHSG
jgi:hypothetical protein